MINLTIKTLEKVKVAVQLTNMPPRLPNPPTATKSIPTAADPTRTPIRARTTTPVSSRGATSLGKQSRRGVFKVTSNVTPHTIRALRQRQAEAAQTPAYKRRQSGRVPTRRSTPRDTLRNLSRALVKTAALNEPTPRAKSEPLIETETESDDEIATGRPSLSMPLEELEEDDSFQAPPTHRSNFSDPDQYTQRSVEVPRRASGEQLTSNLTRASLGTIRNIGSPGLEDTSRFSFQIGAPQDPQVPVDDDLGGHLAADETLGRFDKLAMRVGRFSDFRPLDFADQQEDTGFGFDIPDDGDLGVESSGRFGKITDKDGVTANPVFGPHDLDEEMEVQDNDAAVVSGSQKLPKAPKKALQKKLSLPSGVVTKLASAFARSAGSIKTKINKETLKSIMTASDWFFEQLGEDLAAYADHADRKTIDDTDMILLMKRQKKLDAQNTPFSLAKQHLPRELLQEVRMTPAAQAVKKRKPRKKAQDSAPG